MSNGYKVLILGGAPVSNNRGVSALGYGAIDFIEAKDGKKRECIFVTLGKEDKRIQLKDKDRDVEVYFASKWTFLHALIQSLLIRSVGLSNPNWLVALYQQCSVVYNINEGDSFADIYGAKRILRHLVESAIAIYLKKPLIFLPQTIGPFRGGFWKILCFFVLKRLNFLYVRDRSSYELVVGSISNVKLEKDMAAFMSPSKVDSAAYKKNGFTVGLNINGLMFFGTYGTLDSNREFYREFVVDFLRSLEKLGVSVVVIPHTYNADAKIDEDDLEASRLAIQESGSSALLVDKNFGPRELKSIIAKTDLFVGSRMHSCIAALSSNVECYAISYSYKFIGTFDMFGSAENVYEINTNEQVKEVNLKLLDRIGLLFKGGFCVDNKN